MRPVNIKLYIITFLLTVTIFLAAFLSSAYFTRQRTEELKAMEDKIAIDILSFETQYELLKDSSCKTFNKKSLREELDVLASKLEFLESQVGKQNPEVFRLKRYYSLLQIKDYLLTKKMSDECKLNLVFILYFYSDENCPECQTQKYMLDEISKTNPAVEVYSFDYELDLSAVQTLITLHNIPKQPPVIDINGIIYPPFSSLEAMIAQIADLTTATSTKSTPKKIN